MIYYSYIDRFERKLGNKKNNEVKEIFSECGSAIGKSYEYKIVEGKKMLVPNGEVNRQDLIDSFALEGDVVYQIQRFLDGDTSVMNPSEGTYGDFTGFPKTYAELFQRVQDCKNVFDSMPADIKKEFDNSYERFWDEFGSKRFDEVFNKFNDVESNDVVDKPVEPIESEVK